MTYNKKSRNSYDIPVNLISLRDKVTPQKPPEPSETSPEKKKGKIPITPKYWKDYILKVVREVGEEGINREDLWEKTRKSIGLGVSYYNRLDKLIDELVQEGLIFESKTDHFKVI